MLFIFASLIDSLYRWKKSPVKISYLCTVIRWRCRFATNFTYLQIFPVFRAIRTKYRKKLRLACDNNGQTCSKLDYHLWKYLFWQIWYKKLKLPVFSWNVGSRLIRICRVRFFCFRPEIPFFGKIVRKNQNCQFKLKFSA